jgi:hypothetical protein
MSVQFKASRNYPNIPTISDDVRSHTAALIALKEAIEIHERRTKDINNSFVRVSELEELGLIELAGNNFNIPGISTGEDNVGRNLGAGTGLYAGKSGVELLFRSLIEGTNITFGVAGDSVTINSTGGGGTGNSWVPGGW